MQHLSIEIVFVATWTCERQRKLRKKKTCRRATATWCWCLEWSSGAGGICWILLWYSFTISRKVSGKNFKNQKPTQSTTILCILLGPEKGDIKNLFKWDEWPINSIPHLAKRILVPPGHPLTAHQISCLERRTSPWIFWPFYRWPRF